MYFSRLSEKTSAFSIFVQAILTTPTTGRKKYAPQQTKPDLLPSKTPYNQYMTDKKQRP